MATHFDDVGKAGNDHVKNVYASNKDNVEAELTAKASCGAKVVFIAKRNADGTISGTFKPSQTFSFSGNGVSGEWKGAFATDNSSKIDTTFTFASLAGFKLKAGTNDTILNFGADYVTGSLASSLNYSHPFRDAKKAPKVEAAANYGHGCYSFGAKVSYPIDSAPTLEGKFGLHCGGKGDECSLVLSGKKSDDGTNFAANYFHELSKTRTLASTINFAPGSGATFLGAFGVILSAANQVNADTLVKARYDTERSALGFGLVQAVNSNVTLEVGTDFPAALSGNSVYNLKFVYKA
uniref:Uncharacterized protein n=1 Tax=Paramoeba aestuarina TaxID=180227 RepID=A0A7S4UQP2_9EUKA|eukprot:CAMPEP_0201518654 /NCGR_PEP_ID=MMETSP0161_2-20130828/9440_1 /ASSEMBLY_ACC=CAM_ASM_000251 /TAXON_ID=180227 /ORGANISM="Neoparamoeba aestuarina, Strain SoJaBio B1-5/56/2" /LENGTH=293 /DNA_ID=CAMNT_0047916487 /DNA_START=54 /DNA_END=935 /DNA_ORIENTATION=+